MHLFKPVASRSLRKKYIRNAVSRERYHANRYQPFGYSSAKRDKMRATTGRLNKRRSFF